MPVTAKLKELKIAPRKVRLVAELIRGRSVKEAQGLLRFTVKKGCLPVLKLLNSAVSSANNNSYLKEKELFIAKIFVDEGHKQRKFRARARGTASFIKKRSSHVTIILDARGDQPTKEDLSVKAIEKTNKTEPEKTKRIRTKVSVKSSALQKKNIVGIGSSNKIFRRKAF